MTLAFFSMQADFALWLLAQERFSLPPFTQYEDSRPLPISADLWISWIERCVITTAQMHVQGGLSVQDILNIIEEENVSIDSSELKDRGTEKLRWLHDLSEIVLNTYLSFELKSYSAFYLKNPFELAPDEIKPYLCCRWMEYLPIAINRQEYRSNSGGEDYLCELHKSMQKHQQNYFIAHVYHD